MKALLIVNPAAGRGKGGRMGPKLAERLGEHGVWTEVHFTHEAGDAKRKAGEVNGTIDLVIAVGGDGTLNEVLNGLPPAFPVALFPMGTANVLSLELNLPKISPEFCKLVAENRYRSMDLFRANGRLGFFALGVGFDGMIIEGLAKSRKGTISQWSYVPLLFQCLLRYKTPDLTVTADSETFENISFALIANTQHYGGSAFSLSPNREWDDGLVECYLFRGKGRLALLRYLFLGLLGKLHDRKDPIFLKAKRVKVESAEPVPYEIDGEFGGKTPVEMEVVPQGMRILAP